MVKISQKGPVLVYCLVRIGSVNAANEADPIQLRRSVFIACWTTKLTPAPAVALVAGISILIQPGLLSVIVAIYLIVTGILGLMGARPTGRWWQRE